jgi:diaminopimelate epimerase
VSRRIDDVPSVRFAKVEALGNDFLVIEAAEPPARRDALARAMCDRRRGVGADGLLIVYPGTKGTDARVADARVEVWNADGSEAETSGNGLRCAACWIAAAKAGEQGAERARGAAPTEIVLETKAGRSRVLLPSGPAGPIRVALGSPRFSPEEIPMIPPGEPRAAGTAPDRFIEGRLAGIPIPVTALSVGNPHAVLFVDGPIDGSRLGPQIESHPAFPQRANVEFVRVVAPDHLAVVIWERGVGPTASSGTGAAASLVAAALTGRSARRARVGWDDDGVWTEGPARIVFEGEWRG